MDRPAEIRREHACPQDHRALSRAAVDGAARLGPTPLRAGFIPRNFGQQSPVYGQVQKTGLTMKILVLFDVARRMDPDETFCAESLKQEQKPTEADVLQCLQRLGHEVETLAVFDDVTDIVEKLR